MQRIHLRLLSLLCLVLFPAAALAHVGSRDVFEQVNAGPYKLFVTVRVPAVIPGLARVEVKSSGARADAIGISSALMATAALTRPAQTPMLRNAGDPASFGGNVWLSAAGSWEIRFAISGVGGERTVAVPVPAVAQSNMTTERSLAFTLGMLALLLLIGAVSITAASLRDARSTTDKAAARTPRLRALAGGAAALAAVALLIWSGTAWWSGGQTGYRPLGLNPILEGNQLNLNVITYPASNKAGPSRPNDDFLPDHGHLMHLYMIRWPQMDAVFHLHPVQATAGDFRISLPAMPGGEYRLFGDIVHRNGFPETLVASLKIPADMPGGPLGVDDAEGRPQPLNRGMLGAECRLPDGYVMIWDRPAVVTADTAYSFRFRLLDPQGLPVKDMQPYLGMAGHAAFVKTDGTVFAHTHPEGSAAMAAMMLAQNNSSGGIGMAMNMAMHSEPMAMDSHLISNVVEFPYGFPSRGRYRIFIQMKHGTTVETGTFDTIVK